MEFDAEVEDEDPEEGDGTDRALALDEPGLSGELDNLLGGDEAVSASSTSPSRSGVGRSGDGGCRGIP